jgi:hypothetical protein
VSPEAEDQPCPPPQGEFDASDCAWVRGRAVDVLGQPLVGIGLRVDSVDEESYAFASKSTVTAADGHFELVVERLDPARREMHVDSATVPIKGYLHDPSPNPKAVEDLRAVVLMFMAPLGKPVRATEGDFVFAPVPRPIPRAGSGQFRR